MAAARAAGVAALGIVAVAAGGPPAAAPAPAASPQPPQAPQVLTRVNPQEWTAHIDIRIESFPIYSVPLPYTTYFAWDQAVFVYPLIPRSATHELETEKITSQLLLDDAVVDDTPTLLEGYQAGERLGRWDAPKANGRVLRFIADLPMVCYEVRIDEKAAKAIPWPKQPWSPLASSALLPQLFVESDDQAVVALARQWTRNSPHSVPPYMLAKALAGKVVEFFQPQGQGVVTGRTGRFAGMDVHGAAAAARFGTGSPYDMAALLCAVYRASGLPARIVVALDIAATEGKNAQIFAVPDNCGGDELGPGSGVPVLRAWVEFYLLDEANPRDPKDSPDPGWWIPVDPVRLRGVSSTALPMDQPWPFVGQNDCTDNIAPLSFHFHPPSTVVAPGPPALFGWLASPAIPPAEQAVSMSAAQTVRRGAP